MNSGGVAMQVAQTDALMALVPSVVALAGPRRDSTGLLPPLDRAATGTADAVSRKLTGCSP